MKGNHGNCNQVTENVTTVTVLNNTLTKRHLSHTGEDNLAASAINANSILHLAKGVTLL